MLATFQSSVSPPSATHTPPRDGKRPHQKVRSGCLRCKARRVKCNENKPQCSHCERHREACIYPPPKEPRTQQRPTRPVSIITESSGSDSVASGVHPEYLPIRDLELMHQWTFHSYKGFGDREVDRPIWAKEVPEMAFGCTWLLRGILSVAALHLCRTRPDRMQEYLDIATIHQDLALGSFREIMENVCSTVNAENCHAVIAFAGLTVAFGFIAEARLPLAAQTSWLGTPEWIKLLRGPRQALGAVKDWVVNGPMAYQLRDEASEAFVPASPYDGKLIALETMIGFHDEGYADIYNETLTHLRRAYDQAYAPGKDFGPKLAMYSWVARVPPEFFDHLLDKGKPEALILLSYLCVLVKGAAQCSWYMEGSGEATLARICKVMPEEMMHYIDWPLHEIRNEWLAQ